MVLWFLFSSMTYIIHYYCDLFSCLNYPRFGYWQPLERGFCVLMTCSYHSLGTVLLIWKYSRLLLSFPCPSPGISQFFKEACSFSWRMVFRIQDLGTGCSHCFWGVIPSGLSRWAEIRNICIIYTHLFLFLSTCAHIDNCKCILHPIPVQTHAAHSSLPPFSLVILSSDRENPSPHIFTHLLNLRIYIKSCNISPS